MTYIIVIISIDIECFKDWLWQLSVSSICKKLKPIIICYKDHYKRSCQSSAKPFPLCILFSYNFWKAFYKY